MRHGEWLGWGWFYSLINGLTADAAPDHAADYVPALDASAGKPSKVLARYIGAGRQTISIPAGAMTSRTSNGPATATLESTTYKVMRKVLDFDKDADEFAQFAFEMPKGWNGGTVSAAFIWEATNTGDVVWGIQGLALSDDDVIDTDFGTAVTVTDSVTAAGDKMRSPETGAVTLSNTPAEGDTVVFQVFRDANNVADTCAVDARLWGVALFYTTNANVDT